MNSSIEFSSYPIGEFHELCLLAGKPSRPKILIVPPLFDEMNRMRRMLIDVMRSLANWEISTCLMDLPGTNESMLPRDQASLSLWQESVQSCADHMETNHIASFRGGILAVDLLPAADHWQFSPIKGRTLLRTMMRTRIASDKESGVITKVSELEELAKTKPVELAGNQINPTLFSELQSAHPPELQNQRVARLLTDSKPCDIGLEGSALWLRAEPDADISLSKAIAKDLADWIGQ